MGSILTISGIRHAWVSIQASLNHGLAVSIQVWLTTFHLMQLCDLYNNDAIFDKFECCLSRDGLHFATGSYRFVFF